MHRSLPIEAELSSPTTRFSFAGLEFHSGKSSSFSSSSSSSRGVFLAWACRSRALPGRGKAAPPILQTAFARNDFSLRRPCHP